MMKNISGDASTWVDKKKNVNKSESTILAPQIDNNTLVVKKNEILAMNADLLKLINEYYTLNPNNKVYDAIILSELLEKSLN